ncbi:hypothetical protein P0136_11195 [Lentisphaerota bacterium ZTH]|nr:hypothetical protein JYG24_11285 [Lentisphaerota bacterium]WET05924.1 hypothetical protein P0136_11195 [Lentisphaerota bacterium ZTH]
MGFTRLDIEDIKLRKLFYEELINHIKNVRKKLNSLDHLTDEQLYESYLVPCKSGKNVEDELFYNGLLEKSIGEKLSCYCSGIADFASGLVFTRYGFRIFSALNRKVAKLCDCCTGCIFISNQFHRRAATPINIKLTLQFDRILDNSDIVIFFSKQDAQYRLATRFLLYYFKVFSNKKAIVGIEGFNEKDPFELISPDLMKSHLQRDIINETANDLCPHDIPDMITKYGLSTCSSKSCTSIQKRNADLFNLLTFIECRCKNAFCFNFETLVSSGRFMVPEYFHLAPEYYYDVLKIMCEELAIPVPSLDEILNDSSILTAIAKKIIPNLQRTNLYRKEVAQKACSYFTQFRRKGSRIPLILIMNEKLLLSRSESGTTVIAEETKRIQKLIKEKLDEINTNSVRVTAIGTLFGVPRFFELKNNPTLELLSLNYVMGFYPIRSVFLKY